VTLANAPNLDGVRRSSPVAEALARASIVPITVEQYHEMVRHGILPEDGTVELLRGVLVRKDRSGPGEDPMGHSPLHKLVISLLSALAARINSPQCHVQIQLPVSCPPDGEPEPDASIVRGVPRDYSDRIPGAADISCVIEVAHSSLERDREDKLPIYAAAAIQQYVLINLANRSVEVYSDPDPAIQTYGTFANLSKTDTLTLRLPIGSFDVPAADVLP
jgi:Uma2 family endonuclease